MLFRIYICVLAMVMSWSVSAERVQLNGQVQLDNQVNVAGAIVTLTDANGVSESVYTNQQGGWSLKSSDLTPPLTLRVRAGAGYADAIQVIEGVAAFSQPSTLQSVETSTLEAVTNLATEEESTFFSTTLEKLTDPKAVSERLTASAHAASVRWKSAGTKQDFVSQCHFCHQIGNSYTRRPKTEEEWLSTIERMQGYGALITWKNEEEFAATLSESFDGSPVEVVHTLAMHDDLPKARMREWAFGGPVNYVHDIEQGVDGLLYGVDMSADKIWILNPKTNGMEVVDLPPNDLPRGGHFDGAVAPLGTFAAYHGPHSIVEGPDHKMYLTCSLSGEIGIFDPVTRRAEFVDIGADSIYPHTLRFDKEGTLWFTLALSNQIGRMNIETREITLIDLPSHGFFRWVSDVMLPTVLEVSSWFGREDMHVELSHHKVSGQGRNVLNLPYGIDIDPNDGSIWYSKLYAGYIGRVDPKTLEVTEIKTPHASPRRLRFDAAGTLWIPSFEEGVLMKFDPASRTFVNSYKLPLLAENEYETPYALAVHPQTQQVWIAANMSDRILRFDPQTETFAAYPSPTRVTFLRDFIFRPDGEVCTSNANLPSGAIEGGRPKFMCLDPEYVQ